MGNFLDHSGLSYLVSQLKAAIAKKADAKLATESYVSDQLQTLTTEEIDAAVEAAFSAV